TNPRHDPRRAVFKSNMNSTIWDLAWEASDALTLENRVIYTDFNINRPTAYNIQYAEIDGQEVHVEPVVRFGGADSRLHWLAGLRYFHGTQDEFVNIFGGSTFKDKTDTHSAFAELTYALTPQVDVTAASRLEREHRRRDGGSQAVRIDFDET
ncbi:TonB-dependent receptor, partial [Escherichia coli]